jgi:hypothetical protein
LEAGAHTVEFRFKPKPLLYGALLSLISLISMASALVLAVVWKRV